MVFFLRPIELNGLVLKYEELMGLGLCLWCSEIPIPEAGSFLARGRLERMTQLCAGNADR